MLLSVRSLRSGPSFCSTARSTPLAASALQPPFAALRWLSARFCAANFSLFSRSASLNTVVTPSVLHRLRFGLPFARSFAIVNIPVPPLGDSITNGTVSSILKKPGDAVKVDDVVAVIETDKVSVDIRSPTAGAVTEVVAAQGATVDIGAVLMKVDDAAKGTESAKPAAAASAKEKPAAAAAPAKEKLAGAPSTPSPAAQPAAAQAAPAAKPAEKPVAAPKPVSAAPSPSGSRAETRVPMSRMRQRIAERLKASQNEAAMLTTFNEIDMTNAIEMRNKYKDVFAEKHGTKLGFMSFFVRASASALASSPEVNAVLDGKDIVYRDYIDISVAVATPTGLVVPVLRNAHLMSFSQIEAAIAALGQKARKGQIAIEDMTGGTFTISNGGVYGSMMGTPIINPPQSAILGMHGIFKRPVVVNDKIEIRQMMYVALTYDHRLIDGSGAVTFLRKIKDGVEDPARLLLDLI